MIFKIDHRLKEAKANEKPFGGISIVLTGDPGQLLPVLAKPLYDKTSKSPNAVKGFDLYQKFLTVVKLKQVVRQQNPNNCPKQQHFIELCRRGEEEARELGGQLRHLPLLRRLRDGRLRQHLLLRPQLGELRLLLGRAAVGGGLWGAR